MFLHAALVEMGYGFLLDSEDTFTFLHSLIQDLKAFIFKVQILYDIIHRSNSPLLTLVFDTLMIRGARKRGQHFKVLSSILRA